FGLVGCKKTDVLCAARTSGWQMLGTLGGAGAGAEFGATAGLLCGPLVEVCSPAGAAIGGIAGAIAGFLAGTTVFQVSDESSGGGSSSAPQYKVPRSGQSGEEAASDIPSWAQGERPLVGESGKDFARRLLDQKYGAGKYKIRGDTEFSRLKKYADRHF